MKSTDSSVLHNINKTSGVIGNFIPGGCTTNDLTPLKAQSTVDDLVATGQPFASHQKLIANNHDKTDK